MNQIPKWKKEMHDAERQSIKKLLVTFFSDYLTEDGLQETEYTLSAGMSDTDKLFALTKLYFWLENLKQTTLGEITHRSITNSVWSCINEMIEKHFKEKSE